MARIPLIEKESASPEVLAYYDRVAKWLKPLPGPRAEQAAMRVPQVWRALAHSPELATRLFEGSSLIFTGLDWANAHPRARQFLILAVMRRLGCEYAYIGHWATSERAGISRELYEQFATIEGLEAAKADPRFTDEERFLIRYADDLARTGQASPALFEQLLRQYGPKSVVEITAIVGYRMLTSVILNAFDLKDD